MTHDLSSSTRPGGPSGMYYVNKRVVLAPSSIPGIPAPHRCVPPVHSSIPTLGGEDNVGRGSPSYVQTHSNQYHVYGGANVDYTIRLNSKQIAQPKIVGIDGRFIARDKAQNMRARRVNGFFPPVKIRQTMESPSGSVMTTKSGKGRMITPPMVFELVPEASSPDQLSVKTSPGMLQQTPGTDFCAPGRPFPGGISPVYHHTRGSGSADVKFAPPRRFMSRSNPWVYRYKVKRSMNDVNRVMCNNATGEC